MNTSLRPTASRPAFTLIELLVVISIISVLLALMLPSLSAARESARRLACAANLKALGTVSYLYEQDYKQLPPGSNHSARNYIRPDACNALRNHYGFAFKSTICPDAGPFKGTSGHWENPTAGLGGRLTYFYLGGWGGLDPDPSNFKFGSIDSGWATNVFLSASQGHGPLVTTLKPGHRLMPTLSNHFLAADLAMYGPTFASYIPLNPNHGTLRDPSVPDGANALYGDGHVAWGNLAPGVGWVYWSNGATSNVISWNPPYTPTGATLMP